MSDHLFLDSRVKLEPLVCGWYAWPHLLAPLQLACNVAFRQLPLLKSFLRNPAVHVAAAADPSLFGGPFVDLLADRSADVAALLADMEQRCGQLISLAEEFRKLDQRLQDAANGYSLAEYYASRPQRLAGLVEFLYDSNNHARVRAFEELLYDEALTAATQEIMLSLAPERDRTFFMSTPRLRRPESVCLRMPFRDSRIDTLSSLRTMGRPAAAVTRDLGLEGADAAAFERLLTSDAPHRRDVSYEGPGVRVRYFGHACVLLQTQHVAVLIDPMVAMETGHADGRFTFYDLPDHIDYVVISHGHQDHCAPEMLLQLRNRIGRIVVPANNSGNIMDPSIKLMLRELGMLDVAVLSAFDEISLPEGKLVSIPFPGEHADLDIHTRQGVYIELMGRRFAFFVDSDGYDPELYRRIAARIGKQLHGLFIGMECHGAPLTWLYGPLLTKPINRRNDESRRLSGVDSHRAGNLVRQFEAQTVFVYALGQEPWLKYLMGLEYTPESIQLQEVEKFLQACRASQIKAERLFMSKELLY